MLPACCQSFHAIEYYFAADYFADYFPLICFAATFAMFTFIFQPMIIFAFRRHAFAAATLSLLLICLMATHTQQSSPFIFFFFFFITLLPPLCCFSPLRRFATLVDFFADSSQTVGLPLLPQARPLGHVTSRRYRRRFLSRRRF